MSMKLRALKAKALFGFSEWFISARGVYQTFALVSVLCAIELLFPKLDAHGFWLLYYLTVYSAITQPALAYVSGQSSDHSEDVLKRVEELEITILAMEERILARMEAIDSHERGEVSLDGRSSPYLGRRSWNPGYDGNCADTNP